MVTTTKPFDSDMSQKNDVTSKLIARFKTLISEGVLVPGCRLPSERELAKRFKVSRPSLRQALKVLEIMGVISQKIGDGTYLNRSATAILGQPIEFLVLLDGISHHELFEARLIVEPELAKRAAEHATVEDLEILRQQLKVLEDETSSEARIIEADIAFHDAIFQAAGNRVCRLMFSMLQRALLTSMKLNSQRGEVRETLLYHKAVYTAIEKRNAVEAYETMREHINEAKNLLLRSNVNQIHTSIAQLINPLPRNSKEHKLSHKQYDI